MEEKVMEIKWKSNTTYLEKEGISCVVSFVELGSGL